MSDQKPAMTNVRYFRKVEDSGTFGDVKSDNPTEHTEDAAAAFIAALQAATNDGGKGGIP